MAFLEIPPVIIVSNHRGMQAYLVHADGIAEIIEHKDFQADGQTNVPVVEWTSDQQGHHTLVRLISGVLDRYRPASWGLACPGGLCGPLVDLLPSCHRDKLVKIREVDTHGLTVCNVTAAFGGKESAPCAECPESHGPP